MKKKQHTTESANAHEVIGFLEDRIYEHNSGAINQRDGDLFAFVIKAENEAIIGGVAGWTWAGACEITQLWVSEACRNQGIGLQLIRTAEAEARLRGARTILVRSYSFQAPDFYAQQGYRPSHIIEDFPPGHRYHFLIKKLY